MDTEAIFTEFETLYNQKDLWPLPDKKHLIKDGVINPAFYANQKIRVLFIAKDHNLKDNYDYIRNPADYRLWWNEIVYLQFAHRLGEWAHGILNDFPEDVYQISSDQKLTALKSIAFINVKKVGGGATVNRELIKTYISESRELLHQQIQQINPTLIVCCLRDSGLVQHLFNPTASNLNSIGKWNGIDVINFWHPFSRKSKQFLYQQLKEAVAATQSAG